MTSLWRKLARAFRLRCPRCGSDGIRASWFKLGERCPRCDLALDRGEADHWLGAFTINWVVGEGLAAVIAIVVLVAFWPRATPGLITGIVLALAMPVVFYPFSQTIWLAFDLHIRPLEPGDTALPRQS